MACHQPAWSQQIAEFEPPALLNASHVLDPILLRDPHHRVRDQVVSDGYLAHFEIDTDFGVFQATGVPEVKMRITEAEALAKLTDVSMLAERQAKEAAEYKELHVHGRLPAATTAAGITEVPAPVDHVTWTEQVAAFAQRDDLGKGSKLLVHTGILSEATIVGLKANGWQTLAVSYP